MRRFKLDHLDVCHVAASGEERGWDLPRRARAERTAVAEADAVREEVEKKSLPVEVEEVCCSGSDSESVMDFDSSGGETDFAKEEDRWRDMRQEALVMDLGGCA